ncbi:hypothetical protein EVAR_9375_1 [Eumeta japonica]|uniref:Tudor domain-containing protein n=1 Tax=Eumeta variegata TaxID=151549 RepID=A0A4C1SD87_EUMVA|nr:hypothetical protein EVAR_9375_1 [Eumeta japonica]
MQQPMNQIIQQFEEIESKSNKSQDILSDSPIYEPEEETEELKLEEVSLDVDVNTEKTIDISENIGDDQTENIIKNFNADRTNTLSTYHGGDNNLNTLQEVAVITKRKLTEESTDDGNPKILKLEVPTDNTPSLDQEVSDIIFAATKSTPEIASSSITRIQTPVRSSPRKITKRSNSNIDITSSKSPKTPKSRPVSADILKSRIQHKNRDNSKLFKTFKQSDSSDVHSSDNSHSRPSVEFVKEIRPAFTRHETISDEGSTMEIADSQNFHLVLSPVTENNDQHEEKEEKVISISEPTFIKNREGIVDPGKIHQPHSEGYNYSDQSNNLSQPIRPNYKEQTTDLESTDTASSIQLDSPENMPTMASKMISKLSNGNSSTPSDVIEQKPVTIIISDNESDGTRYGQRCEQKGKRNDSFRLSNNTTPSTISPLPNGHTMPLSTPQVPTFDIHWSNNEDGEFLSISSTTTSNRTCDGAFVVPQPPRKSVTNPGSVTVKGIEALTKKINDLFSHIRDTPIIDSNQSNTETKVSIGIQASPTNASDNAMSNGNASPEEVGKCDKVTPKSSLKKTRMRGRRPLTGKTKRAILPTQAEEPEYMHGVNSPEIIPMNGESKDLLIKTSLKEEKLQGITGTPKSVNKLKQKKSRPTSPRPPTPVEKGTPKTEFLGYPPDTLVLAKWVDKRYYSGKVLELIEPNKYLIKFDDSRTKVLLDDFIIFGNMKTLPLQGSKKCARSRDKGGNSSAKKRIASPKSPKASTSGLKTKGTVGRKRLASESSELSESSNSAPPVRLEEVAGVEPEVQRTPRKIDGVKAYY